MTGESVWARIAYCNDVPLREGRAVRVGNREIAIFNTGSRFLAVDNRCPHRGGPLADGIVSGKTVVCPLHAWKFNLETGEGISASSQASCVEAYRTRIENGVIMLEIPLSQPSGKLPPSCLKDEAEGAWGNSHPVRVIDEL